jgi:DNA-binding transcriptional regulator PaaX
MKQPPTKSESKRIILNIYKKFNIRQNEMLLAGNLITLWAKTGHENEFLLKGLEELIGQGLIEQKKVNATAFFLTEKGFAEI